MKCGVWCESWNGVVWFVSSVLRWRCAAGFGFCCDIVMWCDAMAWCDVMFMGMWCVVLCSGHGGSIIAVLFLLLRV